MKAGAGVAAVGGGTVAYSSYHSDGGVFRRRRYFNDGGRCVCAQHYGEAQPFCKPMDTRIHRRRQQFNMQERCEQEQCCGPEHTNCFVNCPVPLPDDASVDDYYTTATPTGAANASDARQLEGDHTDDDETETIMNDESFRKEYLFKMRRLSELVDDGAGRMCPSAPPGCLEDFLEAGTEWENDPACSKFIGDNMYCDQTAEDAEDDDTEVEESGTRLGFLSAAFFVWMGCA